MSNNFSSSTVEDMIKEVDVDGDGKIDFYEFVHALGEPEDSQDIDEEDEFINSPLPTPKSNDPSFSDILSQWFQQTNIIKF